MFNAKNIPLNQMGSGTTPQMGDTLSGWTQKLVFNLIEKKVINYKVVETATKINFPGVWQPMSLEQLQMKPTEQRAWSWFIVHSTTPVPMKIDDIVNYLGKLYRVMSFGDYKEYGYYEYHLVDESLVPLTAPAVEPPEEDEEDPDVIP